MFLLGSAAALTAASCGGSVAPAAPTAPPTTITPPSVSWTDALTAADFDSVPTCMRTPASGRGPFPTTGLLERRDITDGYPGRPFRCAIRVVDADCVPIPGAAVEIWHTDASGDYSQYVDGGSGKDEADGTNFCRGLQTAGDDGIVEFHTIYPGWYDSRTIHIHATVYVDGDDTLTTQLYFDEAYTERVMAEGEYAQYGPPDTTWGTDSVAGDPVAEGTAITLIDAELDGRQATVGLINIGIHRS
ncbi:protocatechuate dioxygenase [Ilumatobacter sp.]|uniref:dioxygenase family protein n=1 Tax=Ilumatobacter sp. TaxID=1967498 RepID=UPI003B51F61F